jgi:DNA-binding response OmpR family regulator
VLLADDEEAITENLAPFLQRAGFDVVVVHDGEAALQAVSAEDPAICVLDVLMPRLDGRDVLRRLRADACWQPIIVLTQVGEAVERAMALEEGADDYLNKPFDPHELVARIRAVLRRSRPDERPLATAQSLVSGALRVDRVARRAWLQGRELQLTPTASASRSGRAERDRQTRQPCRAPRQPPCRDRHSGRLTPRSRSSADAARRALQRSLSGPDRIMR